MPTLILLFCFPFDGGVHISRIVEAVVSAALCFAALWYLRHAFLKAQQQKSFLDEQLIQSQKLAAIGELSAGIAHEINNPLAIIFQEVEWAGYQFKDEAPDAKALAELKASLEEIARQVDRCREITHKLLDFARKRDPLVQHIDINKLVEDMTRLVEREVAPKGIEIVRRYNKDLPHVLTDAPLLRQVVLNLLNNAAYAVGENGTIRVQTRIPDNSEIEIVVRDSGCGIPKDAVNKIFDPFFTTKPPGKGTGLGLSICHSIVIRLGGRISVKSEPGKGATFTVRLPVHYTIQKSE